MTLFEYLAIAFGLFFSIPALRLVGGLPYAMKASRRYGPHLGMTLILLVGTAASFWTFWSLNGVAWTFPRFLLALAIPGTLYFSVAMLVPENPEDIESWREHYYDVRVRFYGGLTLWALSAAASAAVNLSMPLLHPAHLFHATIVTIGVLGMSSSKHRVHTGIVVGIGTVGLLMAITIGAQPAWLAH